MAYNLTNFTDSDSYIQMVSAANEYTNGLFGTLILLGFFIVLMIMLGRRYEAKDSVTVSAWTTAVIGMLYMPLGLLNGWVVVAIVALFTIGFIWMVKG